MCATIAREGPYAAGSSGRSSVSSHQKKVPSVLNNFGHRIVLSSKRFEELLKRRPDVISKWQSRVKEEETLLVGKIGREGKVAQSFLIRTQVPGYALLNKSSAGDPVIDRGSQKTVKIACDIMSGAPVARLSVTLINESRRKRVLAEYQLLVSLRGVQGIASTIADSAVEYRSHNKKGEAVCKFAYLQKLYSCSLAQRMACGVPLQIQEIKLIIRCLLQGVVEITERGIIHRDIKIENILLMIDPVTQLVTDAVLADFGLHSLVSDWESRNCNRGSHAYVPPEHASVWLNPETGMIGEVITTRCDDWAIGLTLLLLLKPYVTEWRAFTLPWAQSVKATSPDHYIALIRKMLEELCALQPDWLPEVSGNPVATAVRNLLHPDPAKRWKAATALAFLEEDAKRQDAAKALMSLGKRR